MKMNCSRCQYELSQCLDGRLGSGRRAVVMRHVEGCDACAGFWDELQKAQELVLGLRPVRVTHGFRAQLWERIRSGEGTPEAVFREPVPLVTKVRYVLSGAAAAAAVLVALYIASPPSAGVSGDLPRDGRPVVVADHTPRDRMTPTPMPASDVVFPMQLSPPLLAETAALNLQSNYLDLSNEVRRLEDSNEQDLDYRVRRIYDVALETKGFGQLLVDLETENFVQFSPGVSKELRFFNTYLDEQELRREPTVEVVRYRIVPGLEQARNLGRLKDEMTILVRPDRQDIETRRLVTRLFEYAQRYPESFRHLPLHIPQGGLMSCENLVPEFSSQAGVFFLQDGNAWSAMSRGTLQQFHVVIRGNEIELLEAQQGNGTGSLHVFRIQAEREVRRGK